MTSAATIIWENVSGGSAFFFLHNVSTLKMYATTSSRPTNVKVTFQMCLFIYLRKLKLILTPRPTLMESYDFDWYAESQYCLCPRAISFCLSWFVFLPVRILTLVKHTGRFNLVSLSISDRILEAPHWLASQACPMLTLRGGERKKSQSWMLKVLHCAWYNNSNIWLHHYCNFGLSSCCM